MEENKYYHDMDELMDADGKGREARRRKHARARALAWVVFLLIIALIGCGGYYAFTKVSANIKASNVDIKGMITGQPVASVDETPGGDETVNSDNIIGSIIGSEGDITLDPADLEPQGPTEEELRDEALGAFVDRMSLEDKVAGIFIVAPEQITGVQMVVQAGEGTKEALEKYAVGGIIYADKNIIGVEQFKNMLDNTGRMARYPVFLALEEELGNGVLANKLKLAETKTEGEIGSTMDPQQAYNEESIIAAYLKEYGVNLNLAINADVVTGEESVMDGKAFGSDAAVAGQMTAMAVTALKDQEISGAIRFFPGQGSASADPASGLASTERTLDEMRECEFKSFLAGVEAGAQFVVISHESAPNAFEDTTRCSASKMLLTDIIRKEMGLDDVIIITDAMNKAAITSYYDSSEAAVASVKAGADMILLPESFEEAYNGILEAVNSGVISVDRINASLKRIYNVKFAGLTAEDINAMGETKE